MKINFQAAILPLVLFSLMGCSLSSSASSFSSEIGGTNKPFESVVSQEADASFAFASSLNSEEELYPFSTGTTYYFSSSSSETGDGSITKPFNSLEDISKLIFEPGTSVLFKKGDTFKGSIYLESISGSDTNPITFASYGEGKAPVIDGPSEISSVDDYMSTLHFEKCSNLVVRDLNVKVYGPNRLEQPGVSTTGILFSYTFAKEEKFKNIYCINNSVMGNGTQSNTWGITLQSTESSPSNTPHKIVDNVNFKYNVTHNFGRSGIHSGGWLNSSPKNGNNAFMDIFTNLYFDHNTVYDTGTIGLYILACTDSTMNYNTIYNTGLFDSNQIMEGECGIMAIGCDNCDVMFNEVFNVYDQETGYDAMGIDIDWNTNNVRVMYNYCHDCQGPGIGTMANQNSFIVNNRIENCHGDTNHPGAISITNYTSRYECVEDNMHSVKNLMISDNLVIQNDSKTLFLVSNSNGDTDFSGNQFNSNHLIYTGDNVKGTFFVSVDPELAWYKFDSNKYFSNDTDSFRVLESTPATEINIEDGAVPYVFSREDNFKAWQQRDLNSTYQAISSSLPSLVRQGTASYDNGKINLSWTDNSIGEVWHFNIYDVKANEDVSYINMLGESFDHTFSFTPSVKGLHRLVIQPESDEGVLGFAYIIEVNL